MKPYRPDPILQKRRYSVWLRRSRLAQPHTIPANSAPWEQPKTLGETIALSERIAAFAQSFAPR